MPKVELHASFFSELQIFSDNKPLTIKSRKARALFIYLALNSIPFSRKQLTELFWPTGKSSNLRQAVYELRKLLGSEDFLVDIDGSLTINIDTDVKQFEKAIYEQDFALAIQLYKGKLLEKYKLNDLADFSDWLEIERNRLEQRYLQALNELVKTTKQAKDYKKALALCDKALSIDILNESSYKTAMELAVYLDKPELALSYYQKCRQQLETHLHIKPLAATRELAEQISSGKFKKPSLLKSLKDNEFQVLAAISITNSTNATMLEPILGKDALEISKVLTKLESIGIIDSSQYLGCEYLEELNHLLEKPLAKLLHFRTAEFLIKNKPNDSFVIAKHYLAANEVTKAAPIFLVAAQAALEESKELAKELCFYALWTNEKAENRYQALELTEKLAELLGEKDLQAKALRELETITWQLQDDNKFCQTKLRQARYNIKDGKLTEAIELSKSALEIAQRIKNLDLELQTYNSLGASYFYADRLTDAYDAFSKVMILANSETKIRATNNLGAIAGIQNNLELSYQHFNEALTYARQAKNINFISACLNNLANTAEKLANYGTAEKHYTEVLSLIDRTKDPHLETIALCNLALNHKRLGKLGLAWNTTCEAFDLAFEKENQIDMIFALTNKIDIAISFGDFALAQTLAKENFAYSQQNSEQRMSLVAQWNLEFSKQLSQALFNQELISLSQKLVASKQLDVAVWAYLEMAIYSQDAKQSLEFSEIAKKYTNNKHHYFVLDLIKLKQALLKATSTRDIVVRLEPNLAQQNYTELPLAYCLVSQSYQKTNTKKAKEYKTKAIELLEIQAQGLPKDYKNNHLKQINNWQIV